MNYEGRVRRCTVTVLCKGVNGAELSRFGNGFSAELGVASVQDALIRTGNQI